jgi:hypothetical protein
LCVSQDSHSQFAFLYDLAATKHHEELIIPLPMPNILNPHHDHGEEEQVSHPTQQQPSPIIPVVEEPTATTLPQPQPPPPNSTTLFTFPSLPPPRKVKDVIIRYECGESQRLVPEPTNAQQESTTTNNANNNNKEQASNSTTVFHHDRGTDPPPTLNNEQQFTHIIDPCLRPSTTTTRRKNKKLVSCRTIKTPKELIFLLRECKSCFPKRRFDSRREGIDHLKRAHGKKYCPVCFVPFSRRGNVLKDHFLQFHATNRTEETALCPFCQMSCNYEGIYQHICKRHLLPLEKNFPYHLPAKEEEYNLRRRRSCRVTRTELGKHWDNNYDDTPITSSDESHY